MESILEEKRKILEDLELLEFSISKRIKVNPNIYRPSLSKKDHGILGTNTKLAKGQSLLQQHETSKLLEKFEKESSNLVKLLKDETLDKDIIDKLKMDPSNPSGFQSLIDTCDRSIQNSKNQLLLHQTKAINDDEIYNIFSCNEDYHELLQTKNKSQKHRILSSFTQNLRLSHFFTIAESYDKFLDLNLFYKNWLSLPRSKSFTPDTIPPYLDYLRSITEKDTTIKYYSTEYLKYLKELFSYLSLYWVKIQPLRQSERSIKRIEENFKDLKYMSDPTSKTNIHCIACDRSFAKSTVYDVHLNGKKHKKVASQHGETLKLEYVIKELLSTLLLNQLESTIHEVERAQLLTTRERALEKNEIKSMEADEFAPLLILDDAEDGDASGRKHRGEDENDMTFNPLKLPLGPDGRPIPFWLWKLKGLGNEYSCEICGNVQYKGRSAFLKHFKEGRHKNGLQMLGVRENFEIFQDLNRIEDVLKLLENLQKKQRDEVQFMDNTEEVEDDEGNAMSKKVYDQLRKQGLL